MRCQALKIAALSILTLCVGGLGAQDADSEVRAFQVRRFDAMTRQDFAAVAAALGKDLTYTHTDGDTQTKAQFLQTLRAGDIAYDRIEPSAVEVRTYADMAVVTGRSAMHIRTRPAARVRHPVHRGGRTAERPVAGDRVAIDAADPVGRPFA